jgi:transposase-like protein
VALADGYREPKESWATLLRSLRDRGLPAPVLAVGDGALGSWAILPAYMRKSPKVTEVLPLLYLRGLSTGDFVPALAQFLGSEAGLSPSTVQRLTEAWQAEHEDWCRRELKGVSYAYWWVDGVYFNVRLEEDRDQLPLPDQPPT